MRKPYRFVIVVVAMALALTLAGSARAAGIVEPSAKGVNAPSPIAPAPLQVAESREPALDAPSEPAPKVPLIVAASVPFAVNAISGTKNIPGDYATLALAITDLNTQGVGAGGVTLNLLAGNPQTAPAGGYVIGGTGSLVLTTSSAANPITIQGNGNTITASNALTVGSINDGIFKLVGADYVTLTGFTMQENALNTISATAATNNMTEFGVALFYVTTADGAQNNTIQNNTISLNRTYLNTFGIYSNTRHSSTSMTSPLEGQTAAGVNSNNKVYGNSISNVNLGIAFVGGSFTTAAFETGNDIGGGSATTGNTLSNWGNGSVLSGYAGVTTSVAGIILSHQLNDNASFNTVTSAATTTAAVQLIGIIKQFTGAMPTAGTPTTTTLNNNTITLTDAATTAQVTGITWQQSAVTGSLSGSTVNVRNNLILNCAITGAATSATFVGFLGTEGVGTLNVTGNTVRGTTTTATTGGFIGFQQQTNFVLTTLLVDGNHFGDATAGAVTFSGAAPSGAVTGVAVTSSGASPSCAVSLTNNDFRGITFSALATSAPLFISVAAASSISAPQDLSGNTFTNLNLNTSGSATFVSIPVSLTATGSMTISNNSIVTGFTKAAGGTVTFFSSNASSVTGSTVAMSNNNLSNITLSGATGFIGIDNTDGASASSGPVKTITGNTLNNISNGSGTINPMTVNFSGPNSTISGNTISNITWSGAITGLTLGSSNQATLSVSTNTIGPLTASTGNVLGISSSTNTVTMTGNTIANITGTAATSVIGISSSSIGTVNVVKNKITDVSGSASTSVVWGVSFTNNGTNNASNNLIGNLRAPAASAAEAIRGISIGTGNPSTTNLYYNTIYISATSSGATFGTTGVFATGASTAGNAALNMRNNVITNFSTPNGTGLTVAFRRSSAQLTNYATTSDRNLFYAGIPGAGRLIFYDGTNQDQTLAAYKTRVGPTRDANSVTENPPFLSTTGSNAGFLHINPLATSLTNANAGTGTGVTDDYDGDTRNASTPDIGADEYTPIFTITSSAGANGSIAPAGATAVASGGSQAYTITPAACYHVANVLVDGSSVGAVTSYTFTNVTSNRTIAATFAIDTYTITATAPSNGSLSPAGVTTVNCGGSQAYTISANACYAIANVVVDGGSVGAVSSYTFTNVTANHTISATMVPLTYTITASAGAGGAISPNGATTVNCGNSQAYTIAANACFVIADVLVDGVSVGAVTSYTFSNVTTNHTIAASFSATGPYTITASAGSGGSISPNGATSVACGGSQAYAIAADPCYSIADVLVDGVSQGAIASYTFSNVTSNHTIAASFSPITYTITASAGAGGSISPNGATSVACGGSQAYSIAANACYSIADVLVDGVSIGAQSSYTFANVQANHTIAVSFSLNGPYTITASAGARGSISPNGATSVACGGSQAYTIAADPCYSIADVLVDGVSIGAQSSYTFSNVQTNHTIAASFSPNGPYTITASAGSGGSISPNGATSVACGGSQAYTIAADPCYSIADVLVDGVSIGAQSSYTFSNVQSSHTIAASFSLNGPYTITASAGAGGSISPNGATSVACGGSQAYSITADPCYSIADVLVDGVSIGAQSSYTFSNVQSSHTIAASFSLNGPYTITASAGSGGSISPNGATSVACGGSQAYTIAADPCYSIADVLVDGGSIGAVASYTFTNVQASHTIVASFSLNGPYTITASAGSGGSISPNGATSVACGGSQAYSIAADPCYSIADVLVDGVSIGAQSSYTFSNVQTNHTIAASFSLNGPYTITASAGSGGSISPNGATSVACGGSQAYSIAADPCYSIADVLVDGVSIGAQSSYTFSNVQSSHTIAASFSLNGPYTITASAGAGGSISPNGATSVACGGSQAYTIAADPCYSIAAVLVDGVSIGAAASYTFSNVQTNHTIAASFSLNTYTITASAGSGGSISPNGATTANCGASQAYTIAADPCYSIAAVLVDGVSIGAASSYTFTNVQTNHTIAASFSLNTFTITASAASGGSISPNGATTVDCGGSQAYAIAANSCYSIADVLVDGVSIGAASSYTFSNVQTNHTIAASFSLNTFTITASAGSGGSISPNGATTVNCGASQAYTIAADPCYSIAAVLVDGVSIGAVASYTFTNVQTSHTIAASFSLNGPYTITASAGTGGSISPNGATSVACGGSQAYSIAANSCYSIADVLVDGVSIGAQSSYTFSNVQTHHTIVASFSPNGPYTITASAGSGGSISPNGATSVACGGSQAYSITANSCYSIADVLVDGVSIGAAASYTFTNVQASHTIVASFSLNGPYTITASAGAGGSISPNGATSVACGGSQAYSIAADSCYSIADVLVDGVSIGAQSSYTFSNVQTNHTIAASFSLNGPYTITASAGTGGSISPNGATSVACGGSQPYSISAAPCYSIADVLVDGVSIGAASSYTFTNVQTNHTIAASFSLNTFTITASAGTGGSISPNGATTVNCGGSLAYSISAAPCYTIADVLVDGISIGAQSSYTFSNVQTNHTIAASFAGTSYTINATAGPNGSITPSGNITVNCGANQAFAITPAACYHIADVLVDGSSVGAVSSYTFTSAQANHTIAASFAFTVAAVAPVTGLTATQQKTGNDADGTTKITLAFTAPGGTTVEVYRKGFGDYPLYDNGSGAAPPAPTSYPPAGWTLTSVTASGQTDEPASRDFWYYVAYAKDACGNVSPVSARTSGTLGYHLADVTDGTNPGQGDNTVNTADVSLLGAHYGATGATLVGFEYLDVGPTTDRSTNARPVTDAKVGFDDLVYFALNFAPNVSAATRPPSVAAIANEVSVGAPASVTAGQEFDVPVALSSTGDLQAVSVELAWNAAIVEPLGATTGEFAADGVMFVPQAGTVDAALLGAGNTFRGSGVIARVRFRALASGAPALGVGTVLGRDAENTPVAVQVWQQPLAVGVPVRATELEPVVPNPARGNAALQYSLATAGPVDLAIYSVDGRKVRSLAHGEFGVGRYTATWNGRSDSGDRVAAGIYYARLRAAGREYTRAVVRVE